MAMVRDLGCTHVLVGHSERRSLFADDDEIVATKLKRALDLGLKAVLCFGETLAERESGATTDVVDRQLSTALDGVPGDSMGNVLLAYEPVWAIGTGKNALPEDAQAVCRHVRDGVRKKYGAVVTVPVLYGGSVNEKNAAGLFEQPDIDGGLVGGASLDVDKFLGIYESYRRATEG
jgi:triosephosphate isomerase